MTNVTVSYHANAQTRVSVEKSPSGTQWLAVYSEKLSDPRVNIHPGATAEDRLAFVKALADAATAWYAQLLDEQAQADLALLGLADSPAGE